MADELYALAIDMLLKGMLFGLAVGYIGGLWVGGWIMHRHWCREVDDRIARRQAELDARIKRGCRQTDGRI